MSASGGLTVQGAMRRFFLWALEEGVGIGKLYRASKKKKGRKANLRGPQNRGALRQSPQNLYDNPPVAFHVFGKFSIGEISVFVMITSANVIKITFIASNNGHC